jgi:hypothetical protein
MKTVEKDLETELDELRENAFSLLVIDANGVYIPQRFAEELTCNGYQHEWNKLSEWVRNQIESGPNGEWYWDAWNTAESNLLRFDEKGDTWSLFQNGDLWEVNQSAIEKFLEKYGDDSIPDGFWE